MVSFYARRDKILRDRLEDHLSSLKYRGLITAWHDQELLPDEEATPQFEQYVHAAHIVLLLVSSYAMASYFGSKQIQRVMERLRQQEIDVIPILLRPVLLKGAPFAELRMLPSNGKPVVQWRDRDSAFVEVAYGIEKVASKYTEAILMGDKQLLSDDDCPESPVMEIYEADLSPEQREDARGRLLKRRYYEMSVEVYQTALMRDPFDGLALRSLGNALYGLERYDEAQGLLLQAIQYDPTSATYASLGNALSALQDYDEAALAYTKALELDPTAALTYHNLARTLALLGRTQEAQQVQAKLKLLDYDEDDL